MKASQIRLQTAVLTFSDITGIVSRDEYQQNRVGQSKNGLMKTIFCPAKNQQADFILALQKVLDRNSFFRVMVFL